MTKKKMGTIEIQSFEAKEAKIHLMGTSPLIMNVFSEKAKEEMLSTQIGKSKTVKGSRDIPLEYADSMYWLEGRPDAITNETIDEAVKKARFGMRSVTFKKSAIWAAMKAGIIKFMTDGYPVFHVGGEFCNGETYVQINGTPELREDVVRVGGASKTSMLRYRGTFLNWTAVVPIKYYPKLATLDQLVNWFACGGFMSGIGEYRIQRGGEYGAYMVHKVEAVE